MNVVKELMGHAAISTTAEYYSVVRKEHEDDAQGETHAITLGASRVMTDARLTPALEKHPSRVAI